MCLYTYMQIYSRAYVETIERLKVSGRKGTEKPPNQTTLWVEKKVYLGKVKITMAFSGQGGVMGEQQKGEESLAVLKT